MNKLSLTVWLLASTAFASPHFYHARGEKYCDGPDGEVMCAPMDRCGKGPNFGLCCPMEGGPCTVLGEEPTTSLTDIPTSTAGCAHLQARGEHYCDTPSGDKVMCPPTDLCGKGPNLGLCCPIGGGPCSVYGEEPTSTSLSDIPTSTTGVISTSSSAPISTPTAYPPYSYTTEEPGPTCM